MEHDISARREIRRSENLEMQMRLKVRKFESLRDWKFEDLKFWKFENEMPR